MLSSWLITKLEASLWCLEEELFLIHERSFRVNTAWLHNPQRMIKNILQHCVLCQSDDNTLFFFGEIKILHAHVLSPRNQQEAEWLKKKKNTANLLDCYIRKRRKTRLRLKASKCRQTNLNLQKRKFHENINNSLRIIKKLLFSFGWRSHDHSHFHFDCSQLVFRWGHKAVWSFNLTGLLF